VESINTNNHLEYTPYAYNGNHIVMDSTWWNDELSSVSKDIIEKYMSLAGIKKVLVDKYFFVVPHARAESNEDMAIYHAYLDSFDYQHFLKAAPKGAVSIPFTEDEKLVLQRVTKKRLLGGKAMNEEEQKEFDTLIKKIGEHACPKEGWFVRLSSSSSKKETFVHPNRTAVEIINYLTCSKKFYDAEYTIAKDTCLILIPWNDKIKKRNEFRLFIKNKMVTGVSQQHVYDKFDYSSEELKSVEAAISNIPWMSDVPYKSFVADVWIDFSLKECHLIECNPFGCYNATSSSLFKWLCDASMLNGEKKPYQIRYV